MGSTAAADAGTTSARPHAVFLPYPRQGHVTPMLHLAKLLHARGFRITFVNTEHVSLRLLQSRGPAALDGAPGFRFASMPDGLPPSDAAHGVRELAYTTMHNCLPHLLALLAGLDDVTCLVVDAVMSFGYDAARAVGVPCAALWTSSACGFVGHRHYTTLLDRGLVPFKDEAQLADRAYLDTVVDAVAGMCDGMRLRDFPSFVRTTDRDDVMLNWFIRETERAAALPDAVMINTFDDLERPALDAMRAAMAPPLYAVGPLLLLHARRAIQFQEGGGSPLDGLGSNLWKEQAGVLEWLDGRAPRSVVYVNYGSITVMAEEQLLEFAWGLAGSGHAFVWNIRPDLVKGDAAALLPPEFMASVDDGRALLTTWCPQEEVLAHQAVGVFLTHSGWNSTLESLCAGVPMLSWPSFSEQQTNCRYKRTEWGVGMEIGGEVRREELAEMVRVVMGGEKGAEMHRRAEEWKEKASRATLPGGPAETNLDKVVQVLLSKMKCGN